MCEISRNPVLNTTVAPTLEKPDLHTRIADAVLAVLKAEGDVDLKCWLDWTFVRPLDADALRVKRAIAAAALKEISAVPSSEPQAP